MDLQYINALPLGGFNYDNCLRNKALVENAKGGPTTVKTTKTGTTICGVIFNVSLFIELTDHTGRSDLGCRHQSHRRLHGWRQELRQAA